MLDPVGRQDLTRVEGDDGDLPLLGDGQDAPAGVGRTDLEVVEAAGPAQGDGALAVGDVVHERAAQGGTGPQGGRGRGGHRGRADTEPEPVGAPEPTRTRRKRGRKAAVPEGGSQDDAG